MKKYKMNKNVQHNGEKLDKGMTIGEGHAAFGAMKEQGHLDEHVFEDEAAPAKEGEELPAGEGEGAQEQEEKQSGRRRR